MSPNTRRWSSPFAVDHVAYKPPRRYSERQMCPATADFKVFVTRLAVRWLTYGRGRETHPDMWTPGASAANGGSGHLIDEVAGFSAKVRTQKGVTSISREPENQAEEERSDLTFATIMLRALGHIVLRSTECSVYYYRIVAVNKNLGLVEAQNFVPYIWAPGAEGASGATGYARDHCDPIMAGFCFGRVRREGR